MSTGALGIKRKKKNPESYLDPTWVGSTLMKMKMEPWSMMHQVCCWHLSLGCALCLTSMTRPLPWFYYCYYYVGNFYHCDFLFFPEYALLKLGYILYAHVSYVASNTLCILVLSSVFFFIYNPIDEPNRAVAVWYFSWTWIGHYPFISYRKICLANLVWCKS